MWRLSGSTHGLCGWLSDKNECLTLMCVRIIYTHTFRILSFTSIYSSLTISTKYIIIDLERVYTFNQNSTLVLLKSWKTVLFFFFHLEYNKRMNNGNDVEHYEVLHCVLLSLLVCFFFRLIVYFDSVCECVWLALTLFSARSMLSKYTIFFIIVCDSKKRYSIANFLSEMKRKKNLKWFIPFYFQNWR